MYTSNEELPLVFLLLILIDKHDKLKNEKMEGYVFVFI